MKILFLLPPFFTLLMPSCTIQPDIYSNVYSGNPADRDSPHYLILNNDRSYYRIVRYGDENFERFNELVETGSWSAGRNHLYLIDSRTGAKTEEFTIFPLEGGGFGLKPTLGEGRHSGGLYKPTRERDVISKVYRKDGNYMTEVTVPLP